MNKEYPKQITIGITAFNCGVYLYDAIRSVLDQNTDQWLGILILDGGADNQTKQIFHEFENPKFQKHFFIKNQGPFGTRSKAIEISKTKWYFQLDGDDILPPNAVSDILKTINKNPEAEFIYGDCEIFSKNTQMVEKPINDDEILCTRPIYNPVSPITVSLFNQIGGFAKGMYINADWDFWLSIYERKIQGAYTNSIIYSCRRRRNNVGHKFMSLRPKIIETIISRHPIFFNNNKRKNKARYNVFNKLARYNRALGKRNEAANYVRKAIEYGESTDTFSSILLEEKMSWFRYLIRRIGRLIY